MEAENFHEGPLRGNYAAAYGAMDADVEFISAYPITPQTLIVEKLSELVEEEEFIQRNQKVHFVRMESEHSVAAALVGASYAGARTYSATSGQGLLYMIEMIHWMVGSRLPIVLSVPSRGITGGGWNIWADFGDVINLRDSGAIIQFLASHQEIYDTVFMSYNITEHPDVLLPLINAFGGFTLSHTAKPVRRIPWKDAQQFVRPRVKEWKHIWVDGDRPLMEGALIMPQGYYAEYRVKCQEGLIRAKRIIKETMTLFQQKFGRSYGNGLVVPYKTEDAEVLLIAYGTLAKQAEDAVDQAREQGYKAGVLRLRTYRPFPTEDILEYARKIAYIGVIDHAITYGNPTAGPVSTDVMAVCQRDPKARKSHIVPFIAGLGGRDVKLEEQIDQIKVLYELKETGKEPQRDHKLWGTYWTGLIMGNRKDIPDADLYFGDI